MGGETLLTRMNLASPQFTAAIGGRAEFSRNDIMAALAGLPDKCYLLALVYYTLEPGKVRMYAQQKEMDRRRELEGDATATERDQAAEKWVSADEAKILHRAELYAYDAAVTLSVKHKWSQSPRGRPYLKGMASTALLEMLTPSLCLLCAGEGVVRGARQGSAPPNKERCTRCHGSGVQSRNESWRARMSDVPRASWQDTWGARYPHIQSALWEWLSEVDAHIRRRLG